MYKRLAALVATAFAIALSITNYAAHADANPKLQMQGTWVLASAYEIKADGARTTTYGEHPRGLLMVDAQGCYSLQIFRADRPRFASGVKATGTADEFRAAVIGSSTHTGHVTVDESQHKLVFDIETASYPNWEGTRQIRDYVFEQDTLTYSVPASASGNGTVAYSVWKKVDGSNHKEHKEHISENKIPSTRL
jgi:hypothetical protein